MEPIANPYRPGAGRRPPVLAGRQPLLDAFDVVRQRAETYGEGDRSWVLHGRRGVGKTVLLNELWTQVSGRGWISAKVEATWNVPFPLVLAKALVQAMRTATGRHPVPKLRRLLGVFQAFSLRVDPHLGTLSLGADVDLVAGVADSGRLGDDLTALLQVLGETSADLGVGTLLLIDELQEARPEELTAINMAIHQLGQGPTPLPVMLVAAGLPSLPTMLGEATSYAERLYDYRTIGLLDPPSARTALIGPTSELGVEWHADAVEAALSLAGGYPYFLQSIGKHVWDSARTTPITLEDVEVGARYAREELDDGLYRTRWERATPAQRALLRALAVEGGDEPVTMAALAAATGRKRTTDLSVARNELIKKGLVYPPERGHIAFTVPGMGDFILRQE